MLFVVWHARLSSKGSAFPQPYLGLENLIRI